jgi:undecaprenyl-diphosphatase
LSGGHDLPLVMRPAFHGQGRVPDWLIVIVLGVVEGITEFIPVSSTGHLLVVEHWLKWHDELFTIVIQSAAVLAVIPLFRSRIKQLTHLSSSESRDYLLKVVVAFGITGAAGFLLDRAGFKLREDPLPIACALLIGGVLFVLIEGWLRGTVWKDQITWPVVFAVAAAQLVAAVFPGSSRSGATILAALLLGLSRPRATEFSFLVGIPTMLAAGGWKILKALRHHDVHQNWPMIALGCVVAAIVSFIAVKWLLRFVQTHTFVSFGWYRIVFGLLVLLLLK